MKRVVGLVTAAILGVMGLTACTSTQTQTSQCAIVVQNGLQQNHGVKKVVYPNESYTTTGNNDEWYVPCNARNYIITASQDHGDRHDPAIAMTGASTDGKTPGVQVKVWLTMHWTLNENNSDMIEFWAFCQKYTCQSSNQNDNSANNSTRGWNSMLAENTGPAINRAVIDAMLKFGPDIWNQQSQWPAVAQEIETHILAELRSSVRPFANDFFCADGTTTREGKPCTAPTFSIEGIDPVNDNLRNIQNQQSEMDAQAQQNAQRATQAQQLYGAYAGWELAMSDLIDHCKSAGQTCTVVLGNGTSVSIPQPK